MPQPPCSLDAVFCTLFGKIAIFPMPAALPGALGVDYLDAVRREAVVTALQAKAGVYVRGCLKRGRTEEALRVREWLAPWLSGRWQVPPSIAPGNQRFTVTGFGPESNGE